MATVKQCDTCKEVIKGEGGAILTVFNSLEKCRAEVKLDKDLDWCENCARKETARLFYAAWEANKSTRKTKKECLAK